MTEITRLSELADLPQGSVLASPEGYFRVGDGLWCIDTGGWQAIDDPEIGLPMTLLHRPDLDPQESLADQVKQLAESRDKLRTSGERHLTDLMTIADKNLARAEAAEAEVKRLAAARLVIAVFGVPEAAPQPFALHRGDAREPIALGVQWPGGAVSIKWTPPDRLAVVTSHSLADALTVYDPDGAMSVLWLSEDLGTLAEVEERVERLEARLRDGLTDREREVFIKLVQFVDRGHWYESNDCHPVRGDDCSPYCGACEVLRHVDDQLLREAREAGGYARP
jgi:hypothetical protein